VLRRTRNGAFDIRRCFGKALPGQPIHDIEVDIIEIALRNFDCGARLAVVVDAAERLEMARIEALDADRQPVDARRAEHLEFLRLECAGVRFERDLGVDSERHARAHRADDLLDACRREHARRAAAEKHAVDLAAPYQRQRGLKIGDERVDVTLLGNRLARLVRIEIAIRAFAQAPRNVDVERERRQDREAG